ncbi:peptidoglycan/LPS O-acetylase OafA/YrhL [Kitasatospora sp. MAA4]|uniref:acyltransferase family protein n=1 Tax=Kitasatospora sp. MAA4 TaxID=3035093 RepID=UPI0024762247|nr:acyltransferase [Kitasatospora sp. MAA4]MDH6134879.1 peptidoglycan/LPS O-acetylase OafA/YrhL [Kitasatospora sp. MAA4]
MSASSPARLPSLTGLRFWAALLVVLYHLARQVGPLPWLGPLVWYGRSGVTFFFVLSGFVLAWTYDGAKVGAARFYRRRLARIWPLHALTTALSAAAYAAIGAAVPTAAALWSLLLVHPWVQGLAKGGNPASWSLGDEAWFYLLLPALLAALRGRPRCWLPLAVLCVAAGPALWLAGSLTNDTALRWWLLDYLPLSRTPQFVLGMLAGLALRRGRLPRLRAHRWAAALAGWHLLLVPWSLAAGDDLWYGAYSAAQLGPAVLFAGLITAVAQRDLAGRPGPGPWALRLGQWSYAWYLVQEIVLRLWLHGFGRPSPGPATAAVWLLLTALTLAAAALLHHAVEAPCERLLRGGRHTRTGPLPRQGAGPSDGRRVRAPGGSSGARTG